MWICVCTCGVVCGVVVYMCGDVFAHVVVFVVWWCRCVEMCLRMVVFVV